MDAPSRQKALFSFDNSFVRLPERFFARLDPTRVASPQLIKFNTQLACTLGLDLQGLASADLARIFSGNEVPAGAQPLAMAYGGHQFGGWSGQLGDGRAILLGEVIGKVGARYDVQLKGAGPTPYSRSGDGRAALGPVLREYILSEAMQKLGIKTTRALAAVLSGERVRREDSLPGAVFTRIARSHIRVGTFEYFAHQQDYDGVQILADYVIARCYPQAAKADNPYLALLEAVIKAQAELVASWLQIGFIHGVMNTDNCSVSGETIDYGPCAFMDQYAVDTVYSSIDHMGRYAYGNQRPIAQWNLAQLAQSLLQFLGETEDEAISAAQQAISGYLPLIDGLWLSGMRQKLGLIEERDGDKALIDELLDLMEQNSADFTLTFRTLSELSGGKGKADQAFGTLFRFPASIEGWLAQWRERLAQEASLDGERIKRMKATNPAFIPRNHLVEEVIKAAHEGDLKPFERLNEVLANPYEDQPDAAHFARPPKPEEVVRATFCGT
ncbi:MAG: YdiU family protein [Hyphomicrobiaceae bacterium]|nr:YdiU family protein [Hyphomicrobiaceae bacterium]